MADHARLVTALTKAGATITQATGRADQFIATKGGRCLVWYTQESFSKPGRLIATCVHWPSPQTDTMTDCFCDRFYDTIKGAVASLEERT